MSDDEVVLRAGDELVWGAPPPPPTRSRYNPAIEALKQKPGAWARIRVVTVAANQNSHNMRGGFLNAAKDERFEAVIRPIEGQPNTFGLWARYRTDDQMKQARRG